MPGEQSLSAYQTVQVGTRQSITQNMSESLLGWRWKYSVGKIEYMYMESGWSWVQVPPEAANFFLKNNCFGRVVLCCFVFLLCCVALPRLSKHLMDD